jgi:hypothetical protein
MSARARCHQNGVGLLTFVLFVICSATSTSAIACVCSCAGSATTGSPAMTEEYDHVFSGLIVSTERVDNPFAGAAISTESVVEDPGHWIRSRILVLRVWRGSPPVMPELWTPVVTDCDSPPIAGSYFVAMVRTEAGRSVASNSLCDCDQQAAMTAGRGAFARIGIALVVSSLCAAALALLILWRVLRQVKQRPATHASDGANGATQ